MPLCRDSRRVFNDTTILPEATLEMFGSVLLIAALFSSSLTCGASPASSSHNLNRDTTSGNNKYALELAIWLSKQYLTLHLQRHIIQHLSHRRRRQRCIEPSHSHASPSRLTVYETRRLQAA